MSEDDVTPNPYAPPEPMVDVPSTPLPPPPFAVRPMFSYGRFIGPLTVPAPWPGAPLQAIDAGLAGRSLVRPRWGIPDSVVSQVLTIFITLGFITAYYALTPNNAFFNIVAVFAGLFVQWFVMAGWPVFASYVKGNGPRIDFGFSLSWRDIGPGVVGALACLFGAAIAAAITQQIFGSFGSNAGQVADDLSKHPSAQLLFLLLGVFAAPVVEELAFRGLLWSALAKRGLNPWWCTVITAFAFAAIHMEWVRFGVLLTAGLVLGVLRQTTGRLGPSMLAHMGLNAVAFFASGVVLIH